MPASACSIKNSFLVANGPSFHLTRVWTCVRVAGVCVVFWLFFLGGQFNGGVLFDAPDAVLRCKLVRADYEASGGEAFLTWRKGVGFATYAFGVRVELAGCVRVGGRVLGQGKGVAWFHDVKVPLPCAASLGRVLAAIEVGVW